MLFPAPLLSPQLYSQPKLLCGPACIVALHDLKTLDFEHLPGAFQDRVSRLASKVQSIGADGLPNSIGINSLDQAAKAIGINGIVVSLANVDEFIWEHEPKFFVIKMLWESYEPVYLSRPIGDGHVPSEHEHYVLVYQRQGENAFCWEPSFSGANKSPMLEISWNHLIEGNRRLISDSAKDSGLAII